MVGVCRHPGAAADIEHWLLVAEPVNGRPTRESDLIEFATTLMRCTEARRIAQAHSPKFSPAMNIRDDTLLWHWRWHSDGSCPDTMELGIEMGIWEPWQQLDLKDVGARPQGLR